MGFLGESRTSNPAAKSIRWRSQDGIWTYWDAEEEENKEVKGHFIPFMPGRACVQGYGVWSNEIDDTKNDQLTVRNESGIIAEGTWAEIKEAVKSEGGKWCASVYGFYDGELVRVRFFGSSLTPWFDISKRANSPKPEGIAFAGKKEESMGNIKFHVPILDVVEVSPEEVADAVSALKVYEEYKKNSRAEKAITVPPEDSTEAEEEGDIPF